MNETEALQSLGRLILKARLEIGYKQLPFAKEIGVTAKTVASMERGARMMNDVTKYRVEKALGWREGAIAQFWEDHERLPLGRVDIEDMKLGAGESWDDLAAEHHDSPVKRASQLSDEELLAEITYRFRNYKLEKNGES